MLDEIVKTNLVYDNRDWEHWIDPYCQEYVAYCPELHMTASGRTYQDLMADMMDALDCRFNFETTHSLHYGAAKKTQDRIIDIFFDHPNFYGAAIRISDDSYRFVIEVYCQTNTILEGLPKEMGGVEVLVQFCDEPITLE